MQVKIDGTIDTKNAIVLPYYLIDFNSMAGHLYFR
jgi:hypothetical protein